MSGETGSSDPTPAAYLTVGTVGRAVGLRGEVEVSIETDNPDRFVSGSIVLLRRGLRSLTISGARRHGNRMIVSFAEVGDRAQAEDLKGVELVIAADDARALEADEFWDHDLVGCTVVTSQGEEIGRVTDVLHNPANDVLVVEGTAAERLIPLISSVVRSVEKGRKITIDPTPGLLE
jgi:16S rRNA processing protein RimM